MGRSLPVVAPAPVIRRSTTLVPAAGTGHTAAPSAAITPAIAVQRPQSDDVVRRLAIGSHRQRGMSLEGALPAAVAQAPVASSTSDQSSGAPDAFTAAIADLSTASGVVDFVDWIVDQIEDRLLSELQRRGGRFRGDF